MPGALTGLIPACHTPFDRAGHLNLSIVEQQSALFRESGLRRVFVAGTTGEFASLTVSERKALCERWVAVAGDSLAVALHVGSNCQADSIELAAHARKAGVAAVAAIAPSYFKPATVPDLIDFLAPIAAEAGPLPFYYYHIPCMTNVRLPAAEVLREARGRIPNLRGLKFSHDDMVDLQGCIAAEGGAYNVLFGFDEALLAGLAFGVAGAVGGTYNFAAPLYERIMARLRERRPDHRPVGPVPGDGDDQGIECIRLYSRVEGCDGVRRCGLRAGPRTTPQSVTRTASLALRQARPPRGVRAGRSMHRFILAIDTPAQTA